jgi:hypothetical protein
VDSEITAWCRSSRQQPCPVRVAGTGRLHAFERFQPNVRFNKEIQKWVEILTVNIYDQSDHGPWVRSVSDYKLRSLQLARRVILLCTGAGGRKSLRRNSKGVRGKETRRCQSSDNIPDLQKLHLRVNVSFLEERSCFLSLRVGVSRNPQERPRMGEYLQ